MITETPIMTEIPHVIYVWNFRGNQSFRDHGRFRRDGPLEIDHMCEMSKLSGCGDGGETSRGAGQGGTALDGERGRGYPRPYRFSARQKKTMPKAKKATPHPTAAIHRSLLVTIAWQ